MTYYEELGISAEATAEEIRQAHRRLVKLLHPDQQQDAELRKLADVQMMRVNALVEELLDPQRRAQYNRKLAEPLVVFPVSQAVAPLPAFSRWRILAWLLQREWKLVLLGATGIFLLVFAPAKSPTDSVRSAPVAAPPPQVKPIQSQKPRRPGSQRSSSRGSAEITREEKPVDVEPQLPPEPALQHPVHTAAAPAPGTTAVPSQSPSAVEVGKPMPLVGTWLYAGANSTKQGSESLRYRPEYIELRITDEGGGKVRGDYRSRYAVTDLPISPTVDFVFGGDPVGPPMRWVARNGAMGIVVLKLIQPNVLQVDWKVNDGPPGRMDLVQGSARLVRRL